MMTLLGFVDGYGVYGNYLHYGLVVFLVGSAFIVFLYLWRIKRLDMGEEPKYQMMVEEAEEEDESRRSESSRRD